MSPDSSIQAAFDWGKLNLADMRRTVRDVMVRDSLEGTVYPKYPIYVFPVLSGFGAGYPDYPWFFGTDGAYTVFSLAAVGQWDAAKDHLNTIRRVSQKVNGDTGKVLHEIVTDGSIFLVTFYKTVMSTKQRSSLRPLPASGAGLGIIPFGTTTTSLLRIDSTICY